MAFWNKKKKEVKASQAKEVFYDIIESPVITEKATALSEQNKVVFRVRPDASKQQVKEAIEGLFGVSVTKVNTINVEGKQKLFRGRLGKRKDFKKAVVTLESGQSIDLASGVA